MRILLAAALLATMAPMCPALAQPLPCAPVGELSELLRERYGEVRRFTARTAGDRPQPVEITVGPAGDWTVLVLRPDGLACIVAGGDRLAPAEPRKPGRGS